MLFQSQEDPLPLSPQQWHHSFYLFFPGCHLLCPISPFILPFMLSQWLYLWISVPFPLKIPRWADAYPLAPPPTLLSPLISPAVCALPVFWFLPTVIQLKMGGRLSRVLCFLVHLASACNLSSFHFSFLFQFIFVMQLDHTSSYIDTSYYMWHSRVTLLPAQLDMNFFLLQPFSFSFDFHIEQCVLCIALDLLLEWLYKCLCTTRCHCSCSEWRPRFRFSLIKKSPRVSEGFRRLHYSVNHENMLLYRLLTTAS